MGYVWRVSADGQWCVLSPKVKSFTCLLGVVALTVAVTQSAEAQVAPGPPALLNTNGASDSGDDANPQVTTDGAGNWVAVWHSHENLAGAAGKARPLLGWPLWAVRGCGHTTGRHNEPAGDTH